MHNSKVISSNKYFILLFILKTNYVCKYTYINVSNECVYRVLTHNDKPQNNVLFILILIARDL